VTLGCNAKSACGAVLLTACRKLISVHNKFGALYSMLYENYSLLKYKPFFH